MDLVFFYPQFINQVVSNLFQEGIASQGFFGVLDPDGVSQLIMLRRYIRL